MRAVTLLAVVWSMLVAAVSVAAAEDVPRARVQRVQVAVTMTVAVEGGDLYIPACNVSAESVAAVHTILCDGKVACTRKVVDLICGKL